MRNVVKKSFLLFIWFLFALTLSACNRQPPILPTLAAAAVFPADEEAPASSENLVAGFADHVLLPGTFTPLPQSTADTRLNFGDASPLGPTLTPSITPILPSRTPRPTSTPTPTPLPTETVAGPNVAPPNPIALPPHPALPVGRGSKLGIHIIRNNDPRIMDFIRRAQPAVIKVLDDLGYAKDVKNVSPRTVVIGRVNAPSQDFVGNPEEAARRFVRDQLDQYMLNPGIDYWEGWNEPNPTLANMSWYTRFEQERVRELSRYGFRAAVGGFATGTPELDEFALFLPAIETAYRHGGILTLHEYGAPDVKFLYGEPLPGYPAYPDRGALKFRYRWFYRELLQPAGLVIPLAITEAGIDGIIGNRPGPPGYGWADFQEYSVQQGWGPDGITAFINQLAWYDAGVRQDHYVIGFTVFTAGPVGHWRNYDINPILPQMADYVVRQR